MREQIIPGPFFLPRKKWPGNKARLLYGVPSGIHKVYGECTCDKMADLMFRGKQKTL